MIAALPHFSTVIHALPQSSTVTVTHSPRPTTTVSCGVWGVCGGNRGECFDRFHTHSFPTVQGMAS